MPSITLRSIKQCLYIVGTDTDVGKTVVTAAFARALHQQGKNVLLIKPIQTGCLRKQDNSLEAPDVKVYQDALPLVDARVCVMLEAACSPHLAVHIASLTPCKPSSTMPHNNSQIPPSTLSAHILATAIADEIHASTAEIILIEGAGGLLTPINDTESLADVFGILSKALGAMFTTSMLLVIANKLGAINHALLSCEMARHRGLSLHGFVMTQPKASTRKPTENAPSSLEATIEADNVLCIARMSQLPCLGQCNYTPLLHHADCTVRQEAWASLTDDMTTLAMSLQKTERQAQCKTEQNGYSQQVTTETLLEYDQKHIWHPYTSAMHPLPVWEAVSTQGSYIHLRDGRKLVDGMASWWCAIHGYNHPALLEALHRQARQMPHVMFGGLTHEPAVRLAQEILAVAPTNLEHIFFADSGSVSVEVALKMAVQYQQARGQSKRTRILSFKGAYHGDTLGAMSVCDPENSMHSLFAGILPQHLFAPRPACSFHKPYNSESIEPFERLVRKHAQTLAAVIIEPIVQGAGGMYMYHPEYLRRVSQVCKEHDCLLIADEIATGFGRTGKYFACEHADIQPDILCLGKGLTGGVLSLAATLASRKVAEGMAATHSPTGGVLMHGPTFMGNPLACAVALASLKLLASGTWQEDVMRIEHGLRLGLAPCIKMQGVADVRVLGAIGVVEMHKPVNVARLQQFFVNTYQVWIRPFSRLIYIMPPYCIQQTELEQLTIALCAAVEQNVWQ